MIVVQKEGIILEKTELTFENEGVLNPAIFQDNSGIHMYYRAVQRGNYSSIGYAHFENPIVLKNRLNKPFLSPRNFRDSHGIEDPRMVKIDDLYYLSFTSYDGKNALGSVYTSSNRLDWIDAGIVVPQITYSIFKQYTNRTPSINEKYKRYNLGSKELKNSASKKIWDKNVIFFPRRINGKIYFFHRIKPDIQLVSIESISDLTESFWVENLKNFQDSIVLSSKFAHEISYIGGGCPPIETKAGWIVIYHGVCDSIQGYIYHACVALLALDNPLIELARLPYPLFSPTESYEINGEVNNVCFPTGTAQIDDRLYIYYGAADERIACASLILEDLVEELLCYPNEPNV
jgi:predicted GH43/DUF377 family glycosyl hydrolase